MSLFVLDTDILSLYGEGTEPVSSRIDARPFAELALTVEEQSSGWYDYIRRARRNEDLEFGYHQLASAVPFLARWTILPYTQAAMTRVEGWLKLELNVGKMDLRIAAIALEHGATVVTRNQRDFGRIPGVSAADWAA